MIEILLCVVCVMNIIGWALAVTVQSENRCLRRGYKDALDQWQNCVLLARSLQEDNNRLTDMLADRNIDGESWKYDND